MNFALIRTGDYRFDIVTSDGRLFEDAGSQLRQFFLNHSKEILEDKIKIEDEYLSFNPENKQNPNNVVEEKRKVVNKDGTEKEKTFFIQQKAICKDCNYEKVVQEAKEKNSLMAVTENNALVIIDNAGFQFNFIEIEDYIKITGNAKITLKKKAAKRQFDGRFNDKLVLINEFFPMRSYSRDQQE